MALRPRPSERGRLEELRAGLVASVARVADEPGVVTDPWPTRTVTRGRATDEDVPIRNLERPQPRKPAVRDVERPVGVRWPRRALAGFATAFLTAWLIRHAPGTAPLPTAIVACIAGLFVVALPRAGWLILAVAAAAWLIVESRPGEALVVLAGAAIPLLASPRDGPAWPLAVAAPALGTLGLAAAWPALAGLTHRAHRRAALGATGYLWTALASRGISATTTLPNALHDVLGPVATVGTLLTAVIWAAAAVAVPFTRSRRWPGLECLRLALWAIALALATLSVEHAAGAPHTETVLMGVGAGALVALATSRLSARLTRARSGNDQPPTA